MTVKLAVFDCDGTLSDGQAAVCAAMEEAFAAAGRAAPSRTAIRRIVGLSLPQAIRALDPDATAETQAAMVEAYRQSFFRAREEGRVAEPLFTGIAELLGALHAHGWTLGSKPNPSMLEAAMADAGAAPADTVMIGDTVYDIAMAQAVGVRAIGVAWGYHGAEELLAAGAQAVAQTPAELGELLDA